MDMGSPISLEEVITLGLIAFLCGRIYERWATRRTPLRRVPLDRAVLNRSPHDPGDESDMKQYPEQHPAHRDEPPGRWLDEEGPEPPPGLGMEPVFVSEEQKYVAAFLAFDEALRKVERGEASVSELVTGEILTSLKMPKDMVAVGYLNGNVVVRKVTP